MTCYYFHLHDHGRLFEDVEGDDLPDDNAAREYALLNARDALCTRSISVREWLGLSYEVKDDTGRLVGVVPFAEAIDTVVT
jgi:hypothetical protein